MSNKTVKMSFTKDEEKDLLSAARRILREIMPDLPSGDQTTVSEWVVNSGLWEHFIKDKVLLPKLDEDAGTVALYRLLGRKKSRKIWM